MTTPIKVIIISVLWLLYSLVAWQGCIRQCCLVDVGGETTTTNTNAAQNALIAVAPGAVTSERQPIDFKWSDPNAFTNQGFDQYKQTVVDQLTDTNVLDITGYYHEGEEAPSGFDNMGLARADAVKQLLGDAIPEDRIRTSARVIPENEGVRENFFNGHGVKWSDLGPFDFKWGEANVNLNNGFVDFKNGIMAKMTEDNILEITGLYYPGEPNPDGFENLGLARADAIKELFKDVVPEDRIKLRARLMEEGDGSIFGYFDGFELKWLDADKKVAETVEELEDRIIIRFPYNSTEKDYDPAVDEYLLKLASRLKNSDEKVSLTGHTDNKGAVDYNQELGMNRANAIKALLIENGVKESQIATNSMGQTQPVASNNSDEGRHDNRRVEVRYIKN